MTNTLFSKNKTVNYNLGGTIYKGYTGSAMWLRANTASSNVTTTITNSTFVGNVDVGTNPGSERGALALSRRTDGTSTHNATINNSIFYDNERSGTTTVAINHGHQIDPNTVLVNNSIDEDDFSNIPSGDQTATSNADPLFTSTTDYTLQIASPARNAGDNSKVPAGITTDLAGNSRIQDTTVDMGCYESAPVATYTLTTTVSGTGTISPSGTTTHNNGDSVTVTATAGTGWVFSHWTGDASGSTNPLFITMDANKSVEAVFTQIQVTTSVTKTGNGTANPSVGTTTYNYGDTVSVTATPDTGWEITTVTIDGTAHTLPYSFTITSNTVIDFTFTQIQVTATVTKTGNGTANPSVGTTTYNYGDTVSVTATPDTGWEITTVTIDGTAHTLPYSFTITSNTSISFTFTKIQVTATVTKTGNGTVNPSVGTTTYNYGEAVSVTATSDTGWEITTVTIDGTAHTLPYSFTITSNAAIDFTFTQIQVTATVTKTGNGTINPSVGATTYNYGDTVSVTATPDTGWEITTVTIDGTTHTLPYSFTITSNTVINFTFTQILVTTSVTKTGNGIANPSVGTTTYNYGDTVSVTATPDTGWEITTVTIDGTAHTLPYSFTIISNTSIDFTFTQIQHTLTVNITGNGTVSQNPSVPSSGRYNYGETVQLTAVPATGYQFDGWSGDLTGTTNPESITMDADKTVTAIFSQTTADVDDEIQVKFSVYPNPVSSILNIKLADDIKSVEIYNLLGRKILRSTSKSIDVSGLSKGIYLVKIVNTKNQTAAKRFIKK